MFDSEFHLEIRIAIHHQIQSSLLCLLVNFNCSGVLYRVGFLNATLIDVITNNVNRLIICSSLLTPNR